MEYRPGRGVSSSVKLSAIGSVGGFGAGGTS